jgi:hypothetical protein
MAQHYASWATLVRRFINLLEQTDDFAILELDGVCGWNLWKSWHCHDFTADEHDEFSASR